VDPDPITEEIGNQRSSGAVEPNHHKTTSQKNKKLLCAVLNQKKCN